MAEDQTIDGNIEGGSFGEVQEREPEANEEVLDDVATDRNYSEDEEIDSGDGDEAGDSAESQEGEAQEESKAEPELSEKGTKLDPNPLSRAHQELANERRVRGQMEQVLGDPKLIAQFMKQQYGIEVPLPGQQPAQQQQQTEPEFKEYKPEDFENISDVANVLNGLQKSFAEQKKSYEDTIAELKGTVDQLVNGGKLQAVASSMQRDVEELRTFKELDPKSSEFIDGLEQRIVDTYHQLDFDNTTKEYRGNYSIAQVGKDLIEAVRMGKKVGSTKAQTVVKDKKRGAVKTSTDTPQEDDTSKMAPGDSIAKGIAKMFG
jgi:hypothetical protein